MFEDGKALMIKSVNCLRNVLAVQKAKRVLSIMLKIKKALKNRNITLLSSSKEALGAGSRRFKSYRPDHHFLNYISKLKGSALLRAFFCLRVLLAASLKHRFINSRGLTNSNNHIRGVIFCYRALKAK